MTRSISFLVVAATVFLGTTSAGALPAQSVDQAASEVVQYGSSVRPGVSVLQVGEKLDMETWLNGTHIQKPGISIGSQMLRTQLNVYSAFYFQCIDPNADN